MSISKYSSIQWKTVFYTSMEMVTLHDIVVIFKIALCISFPFILGLLHLMLVDAMNWTFIILSCRDSITEEVTRGVTLAW